MNPDDIFLWPDGFWCFRAEFSPTFLRETAYREVIHLSNEWNWINANGLPQR